MAAPDRLEAASRKVPAGLDGLGNAVFEQLKGNKAADQMS
jgi:hypothetical protein